MSSRYRCQECNEVSTDDEPCHQTWCTAGAPVVLIQTLRAALREALDGWERADLPAAYERIAALRKLCEE